MQPLDVSTDAAFMGFLPGQKEDDSSLIVEFFIGKKLLGAKSREEGREIYEDREFVKIQIKGQDKQVCIEEVRPHHKQKYPVAYQLFQMGKPLPVIGTPVEQLPGVGPSLAHHLKGLNLRTIEDVANVTDENTLTRIGMGARDLVTRAKAFIDKAAPQAVALQEENAMLKQQLAQMNERLAAMEKPKPRGRRKQQEAQCPS